ncbi:NUDIX domain-containing protein [Candidatus Woesearchaeota archaeon]|nr:NUDIX domain-containing protein [Candidatus Woesearchaeota archaeon]
MTVIPEVDGHDRFIGVRSRDEFLNSPHIRRCSFLLLFDNKGKTLLQKRIITKKLYPGLYTAAVSGTVEGDETYEQTIEREMKEEIGISVPYQELFKVQYSSTLHNAFCMVYQAMYPETPEQSFLIQEDEVEYVKWIPLSTLRSLLAAQPELFTPPFRKVMNAYFDKEFHLNSKD